MPSVVEKKKGRGGERVDDVSEPLTEKEKEGGRQLVEEIDPQRSGQQFSLFFIEVNMRREKKGKREEPFGPRRRKGWRRGRPACAGVMPVLFSQKKKRGVAIECKETGLRPRGW